MLALVGRPLALLVATALTATGQQGANYFRGQNPLVESRIYGASANFRNRALETTATRYPEPFRLLFAGDDHSWGCGYKSYPPAYSYANCSGLDEGYRVGTMRLLREATGINIISVGSKEAPPVREPVVYAWGNRHEALPGARVDEIAAGVDWAALGAAGGVDGVVLTLGANDILQHDAARLVEARIAALLEVLQRTLPRARVVLTSVLEIGDAAADAEVRHNLRVLNRLLPATVARRRAENMEIFYVDLAEKARPLDSPTLQSPCTSSTGMLVVKGRMCH